jgi:hypothetical protein
MLSDDIYEYLSSISEITDIVPVDNFGFIDYPTLTDIPYVVYKKVSDPLPYYSYQDDRWQRWRFQLTHSNKKTLVGLAELFIKHLNNYRGSIGTGGSIVSFISCIDNGSPVKMENVNAYELYQDFRINLH